MSADHDDLRRLLGGYLFGGLDETDADRLDGHLRYCDECRAELDRLSGVPELLQRLPEAQRSAGSEAQSTISLSAQPSPENIETLLRRMRAQRTRRIRAAQARWLVAAAVVAIAVAVGIGVVRTGRTQLPLSAPPVLPSAQLLTAQFEAAQGSDLTGVAVLSGKVWGVSVALDVSQLRGSGPFHCEVQRVGGMVEQAAVWGPTPSGSAKVTGASSTQLRDVRSVVVTDRDGQVLGTAAVQ